MELSDPAASRAVLIGVHSYTELTDLPAVGRNLADLCGALTNREIWGLPAGYCRVVDQPADAGAILNAVIAAGQEAQDTLLVYYAGHGLTDQHTDELFLTLPGSDPEFTATALGYAYLRRAVRDPRVRARRKVVILDCCYSGRALEGGMGTDLANRTVTEGTHVLTASGATEKAWSPPGERHTAFTGELVRVLAEGIPDGPGLLTTDAIYQHIYTELRAKGRPLPHQHNRNSGGDIVLARNRAVAGTPRDPSEPGRGPAREVVRAGRWDAVRSWRPSRKTAVRAMLALVVAATLILTATTVKILAGTSAEPVQSAPPGCRVAPAVPPATNAYSCPDRDGSPTVQVYPDRKTLEAAYERLVGDADVPGGTGDCATEEDAEHRYPVTGEAKGRVLCSTGGPTTTVVWTDDRAFSVARVEAPEADVRALRDTWAATVAPAPPFPTADEKRLIDLPVATGCTRAGVEDLDDFAGAVAGVTCTGTGGAGAHTVSYFQFDSTAKLENTMDAHVPGDKDPTGKGCRDGKAPRFTGGGPYEIRGVLLGVLVCRPGPGGNLVMEWSVTSLLVAGRALGIDAAELAGWWQVHRGPPIATVVEAVNNEQGFPNAEEKDLLTRIPRNSKALCMRPSGEFRSEHVGTEAVSAGVVCDPRTGPPIVFYYQFTDLAAMRRNYDNGSPGLRGRCTDAPTATTGESAYSRNGTTGKLRCENRDGYLARIWTDERRRIQAFAFQGRDAQAMSDWWARDAGPL